MLFWSLQSYTRLSLRIARLDPWKNIIFFTADNWGKKLDRLMIVSELREECRNLTAWKKALSNLAYLDFYEELILQNVSLSSTEASVYFSCEAVEVLLLTIDLDFFL